MAALGDEEKNCTSFLPAAVRDAEEDERFLPPEGMAIGDGDEEVVVEFDSG